MTTTPQLAIRRMVMTGSSNRPDLTSRLERAGSIARYDPPVKANGSPRLWLVPSEQRSNIVYLVDRVAKTCTCPDFKKGKAPAGLCKHRLAVEMIARLDNEPEPQDIPTPGDHTR